MQVVDVAQLVRALGCGPGGRGFNSHHPPQNNLDKLGHLQELIINCPCNKSSFHHEQIKFMN